MSPGWQPLKAQNLTFKKIRIRKSGKKKKYDQNGASADRGALLWWLWSRPALLSLCLSGRFPLVAPVREQQLEPPLLRDGELLDAQQQRPPSCLLFAPVDVGCNMLSPRLWAALGRLLLLFTASCPLCETARHGKTLQMWSGADRDRRSWF